MFAYLFDKSYYFPELQFNFFKINRLMSAEEKKTSRKQNWKTIDLALIWPDRPDKVTATAAMSVCEG